MNEQHPGTAADLFGEALGLQGDARLEYLERACAGDKALRDEVESLLASHEGAGAFLENPALEGPLLSDLQAYADHFEELADHPEGPVGLGVGDVVGHYRLESILGEGGMGRVFLAARSDAEFEQQVALKMIKRGVDTDSVLRRFRTERQVLAHLSHAHIARLLDGGATADGLPYLVMEYIRGTPVDHYCDERRLGIEARLELFLQVCEAVEYAHRNLVVHRDLKPSNVLVTDLGEVKLLDFGIAKVLSDDVDALEGTVTRLRAMTPRYASPEQVAGLPVSTASDVYSLGVLLYQLLTGRLPYPATDSPFELERAIRERDPDRPSTRFTSGRASGGRATGGGGTDSKATSGRAGGVSGSADPSESSVTEPLDVVALAEARSSRPADLRRHLRGDLDTLVLHCLRKEPELRYRSVAELGGDIRDYLAGRPISAHPADFRYVVGKFVRRHRALVAAGVAALLALLLGGLGLVVGLSRALQSAEEEAQQRRIAEATNEFLNNDLLAAVNPENTPDPRITMREVLDAATSRLATRYTEEPLVDAAIRTTLGVTYRSLGQSEIALPLLEEALRLREQHLGPADSETLRTRQALSDALLRAGRLEQAEETARSAWRDAAANLGEQELVTLDLANGLGLVLTEAGRYEEAETIYRQALSTLESAHGARHQTTQTVKSNLAQLLSYAGELEESERLYLEMLEDDLEVWGADHPTLIAHRNNLGFVYVGMERYDDAEARFREAVEIAERILDADHPLLLSALSNLGLPDAYRGDFAAIEDLWLQVLEGRRRRLDADHPELLQSLNNVAFLYQQLGRLEEAEPLAAEAAAGRRRTLGERHPNTLNSMNNLGLLYERKGRLEQARSLWEETVELRREVLGEADPATLVTRTNLGRIYRKLGDLDRSRSVLEETVALARRDEGKAGPESLRELGETLADAGANGAAEKNLLAAYEGALESAGGAPLAREVAELLAQVCRSLGKITESEHWHSVASPASE